jgi:glycosyltransferase involved in cell wall biosynthesis
VQTLVVIPTYEEVENAERLVAAILGLGPGFAALVVDDDSPDGTGAAVARLAARSPGRVALITRTGRRGHGSAYRQGLQVALAEGRHDALFVMDCDFSHDPAAIPELLRALDSADVVVGSRYVPGGRVVGWGPHRHVLSRGANRLARAVLHMPIHDCTSGFMGFRRTALAAMALADARAEAYAAPVEMKWLAWRAGLSIVEVPITFRDRERGASKLHFALVIDGARGLWALRAGRSTRTGPRRPPRGVPGPLPRP